MEPYALAVLDAFSMAQQRRISRNLFVAHRSRQRRTGYSPTRGWKSCSCWPVIRRRPHQRRTGTALRAEVAKLREELISPDELSRVVAKWSPATSTSRIAVYQGMRLGTLETVGLGWNARRLRQRIQAVTPEQVRGSPAAI